MSFAVKMSNGDIHSESQEYDWVLEDARAWANDEGQNVSIVEFYKPGQVYRIISTVKPANAKAASD